MKFLHEFIEGISDFPDRKNSFHQFLKTALDDFRNESLENIIKQSMDNLGILRPISNEVFGKNSESLHNGNSEENCAF